MADHERALAAIERVLGLLAGVIMLAVMVLVSIDVAMRYLFNAPLGWAYDLISLYLVAAIFFLALSDAYAHGAHVSVDILLTRASPRWRRWSEMLTALVGIVLFSLIGWAGFGRSLVNLANDDRMSGLIAWPMFPAAALVPLGSAVLVLRLIQRLLGHLASLVSGRDIIPAPIPQHAEIE